MNQKLYKLLNWAEIEEIVYSESDRPHDILGPHKRASQILIQAFFPGAKQAELLLADDDEPLLMDKVDDAGFFTRLLTMKNEPGYSYKVTYEVASSGDNLNDLVVMCKDPYRHSPCLADSDLKKFACGTHYRVYEKLGAHPCTWEGEEGASFAVWAPNAMRVSVVGDFNRWDGRIHQMRRLGDSGVFEIFIPGAKAGDLYKYELKLRSGLVYLKADPYAYAAQLRPDTASVIATLDDFTWEDESFCNERVTFQSNGQPMSIYELYLGSFLDPADGETYANYRSIAPALIAYVQKMGYTHVEFMPIMEHPYDASWGYQVIGYYAPTARYGTPRDFMYLINELHKAGVGVILDWVPAHFPRDSHGLSNFDGTCLYEHKDPRQGSHPHWGTLLYQYGRPQVSNYLIANALFWVEKYHADGIRMDAVASMLYLDYGRQDGQWVANMYGGNENLEAMEFMKHLNSILKQRHPGVLSIAEESSAYPLITGSLQKGGLGFDLKWNMGFMNDFLKYMRLDPLYRGKHHGELTFSLIYAYSEKFLLVFSHDEVVHGKSTLIGKMPGTREQKFANLRLTLSYRMTHPGKKLLFMGQDLGEFDEWNENRRVQWHLEDVPEHRGIQMLVQDLNKLYRERVALHELDESPDGFAWINAISGNESYIAFLRKGKLAKDSLLVVANFAGIAQEIRVGVPYESKYREIFNSDALGYHGDGITNPGPIHAEDKRWDMKDQSISVKMAPLSLAIFEVEPYTEAELCELIEKRIRDRALIKTTKKYTRQSKGNEADRATETDMVE